MSNTNMRNKRSLSDDRLPGTGPCHREAKASHLIAALPDAEWLRWCPQLEPIALPPGLVLFKSGRMLSHVYFPTSAIVSLLYVMADGASTEIAVVGNEGVVGISLFLGGESTPSRALVQSGGTGFRLKGADSSV